MSFITIENPVFVDDWIEEIYIEANFDDQDGDTLFKLGRGKLIDGIFTYKFTADGRDVRITLNIEHWDFVDSYVTVFDRR